MKLYIKYKCNHMRKDARTRPTFRIQRRSPILEQKGERKQLNLPANTKTGGPNQLDIYKDVDKWDPYMSNWFDPPVFVLGRPEKPTAYLPIDINAYQYLF